MSTIIRPALPAQGQSFNQRSTVSDMVTNINTLHNKACRAVEAGEHKFREAVECLTAAKKLGAT